MHGRELELDPPLAGPKPRLRLRLLGLTDLHAISPYDYYRDCPDRSASARRLWSQRRAGGVQLPIVRRRRHPSGHALGDLAAEGIADPQPTRHRHMKHDLCRRDSRKPRFQLRPRAHARLCASALSVVCCNVRKSDGSPWFPPSIVIERTFVDESGSDRRLKVGVIGVAPPQIAQWDEAHVRGRLITIDIVEAVRAELGELRARVDLVVVLCHSGISRLASTRGEENAGQDLAKLDGVDALFLGHQHLLLPGRDFVGWWTSTRAGRIHGKPAVMAGSGAAILESRSWLERDAAGGCSSGYPPSPDATQRAARSR